mmetsp:Transcript_38588/g.50857  ORF Transcript_38588/g.50857 Transcript_38588/m.50857 type:complete len:82 (+) Transcript_38588:784-1029(+)
MKIMKKSVNHRDCCRGSATKIDIHAAAISNVDITSKPTPKRMLMDITLRRLLVNTAKCVEVLISSKVTIVDMSNLKNNEEG